jgi:uncharacterized membrane protein YhhN
VAVIFGAIGDLFLEYGSENYFNLGAASFLVGHVLYNLSIIDLWNGFDQTIFLKRKLAFFACTVFFFSVAAINLATTLEGQSLLNCILFPIYITFLTLNCINATFLVCGSRATTDHLWLLTGAINFYLSDNLLGKTEFGGFKIAGDGRYNSVVIMVTYYAGQYFMAEGIKGLSIARKKL